MRTTNIIYILIFLFISCRDKTYFSSQDYALINIYKIKDTLKFKNNKNNKVDSFVIFRSKKFHFKYELMISNQATHRIYFYTKIKNDEKNFLGFIKPHDSEMLNIYFKGGYFKFSDGKSYNDLQLKFSKKKLSKIIRLKSYHNDSLNTPEIIYWNKKYGIVKYETKNNKVWERID